jgi:hypothetical protein
VGLESRELRPDRVSAAEQRHEVEEPVRARRGLARDDSLFLVDRRYLRARKGASLFVDEPALDLCALRPCGRGDQPGGGERFAKNPNAYHRSLPERGRMGIAIAPGTTHDWLR